MATRKVRVKKLNTKQPLDVLTEDEIDASEYQSLTQELSIATGVEQAEENVRTKSRAAHVTRLPTLTLSRAYSLAAPFVHSTVQPHTYLNPDRNSICNCS